MLRAIYILLNDFSLTLKKHLTIYEERSTQAVNVN